MSSAIWTYYQIIGDICADPNINELRVLLLIHAAPDPRAHHLMERGLGDGCIQWHASNGAVQLVYGAVRARCRHPPVCGLCPDRAAACRAFRVRCVHVVMCEVLACC